MERIRELLQVGDAVPDLRDMHRTLRGRHAATRRREGVHMRADREEHVVHVVPETRRERAHRGEAVGLARPLLGGVTLAHVAQREDRATARDRAHRDLGGDERSVGADEFELAEAGRLGRIVRERRSRATDRGGERIDLPGRDDHWNGNPGQAVRRVVEEPFRRAAHPHDALVRVDLDECLARDLEHGVEARDRARERALERDRVERARDLSREMPEERPVDVERARGVAEEDAGESRPAAVVPTDRDGRDRGDSQRRQRREDQLSIERDAFAKRPDDHVLDRGEHAIVDRNRREHLDDGPGQSLRHDRSRAARGPHRFARIGDARLGRELARFGCASRGGLDANLRARAAHAPRHHRGRRTRRRHQRRRKRAGHARIVTRRARRRSLMSEARPRLHRGNACSRGRAHGTAPAVPRLA